MFGFRILGGIVLVVLYLVVGALAGATLFKRYGASWKWWGSNTVEFLMFSMSVPEAVFYLIFWPGYVVPEAIRRLVGYVKASNKKVVWDIETIPNEHVRFGNDFSFNSAYPTIVKPHANSELMSNPLLSGELPAGPAEAHHHFTTRKIKDDEELMRFVDLIINTDLSPYNKEHAAANNGKELIRARSAARKIKEYLTDRLTT